MSPGRVITKLAAVAPGAGPDVPGLFDAEGVNHWRMVVDEAHERGESVVAQLWHPGHNCSADADAEEAFLDAFRVAAEGASDAGFDGVELADGTRLTAACREYVIEALVAVWGASRVAVR